MKKEESQLPEQEYSIYEVKADFEKRLLESKLFSEWDSLGRTILWNKASIDIVGDTIRMMAPVNFSGQLFVSDGNGVKGNRISAWMQANRIGQRQWTYHMLIYLPEEKQLTDHSFSGSVRSEDWFTGNSGFTLIQQGRILQKNELPMLRKQMGWETECFDRYIYYCVDGGTGNPNCNRQVVGEDCYDYYIGENEVPHIDPEYGDGGGSGGGSPGNPNDEEEEVSEEELLEQIENKPFALLDIPCETIQNWVNTAKRVVQQIQLHKLSQIVNTTTTRPGITTTTVARLQDINNAYSTVVNMDYFPITITQFPIINGVRQTPEQFLEHIRKNINSFVDTDYAEFIPYQWYGIDESSLWNSSNPLGAVIGIDILGPDNGSVIVSDYSGSGWTFSTIYDPKFGQHPVSGHRDFGFISNPNGSFTFYTRGVNRLTTFESTTIQWFSDLSGQTVPGPFTQSDALWQSFQTLITQYVNHSNGNAIVESYQTLRPNWQEVKDVIDGKAPLSNLSIDCQD